MGKVDESVNLCFQALQLQRVPVTSSGVIMENVSATDMSVTRMITVEICLMSPHTVVCITNICLPN